MMRRCFHLFFVAASMLVAPIANATPPQLERAALVAAAAPSNASQIAVQPGARVSAAGEVWESTGSNLVARDVTIPTVTPFLPPAGTGNGAAIIVVPGGGFAYLSMNHEGFWVARWLTAHGIAAFVLKYRLNPTPADPGQFVQLRAQEANSRVRTVNKSPAVALAQSDALAALAMVRRQAVPFHIDPTRVGIIGFSAGAVTAMNAATAYSRASRPDFVASLYGQMPDRPVPPDAPPLFVAVAANDKLLGDAAAPMFNAWRAAGKSAELHIYEAGKHGFGMVPHGTSSDHWIDEFFWWLQAENMLNAPPKP